MIDITLNGESKDDIVHHLAEDVAIALAQSIDKALGDRTKITRFGYALIPMDEALAYVSIDLVKRQFYNVQLKLTREDRKSTRLNSSHANISYAVFCLKKKKTTYKEKANIIPYMTK